MDWRCRMSEAAANAAPAQSYERAPGAAGAALPGRWQRREPERTVLHKAIREHLRTFLDTVRAGMDDGAGLPKFVEAEFERYLACGILAHGFARVRCGACGHEVLVALSCKGRGFCPSCTTRRMQDTAARLVDQVFPRVPVRQWVLSLPRWARWLLARDGKLATLALNVVLRSIFANLRQRARRVGVRGARTGAVTFVQRFGGALNLNVHFHCVLPDGVFVREGGAIRFVPLGAPSEQELEKILRKVVARLSKRLRPRAEQAELEPRDSLGLAQAEALPFPGANQGAPAPPKRHTKYLEGFSLHAGVHLHANDREGLERLLRYGARPPLSLERLTELADGRLAYRLKRPLPNGPQALLLKPTELLRRLATLVPPPRHHLVRYHGVFAPNAAWRAEVIPPPPAPLAIAAAPVPVVAQAPPSTGIRPRIPWAELLLRVFRADVLACDRCGGRRVVLAFLTDRPVVKTILDHLGLPSTAPPIAPARGQFELQRWLDV